MYFKQIFLYIFFLFFIIITTVFSQNDNDEIDSGVTNFFPEFVKTTFISHSCFFNKRIRSRDLYAAIPPPIIKIIFFLLSILSMLSSTHLFEY